MNYIENVYVCLAAPQILAIFCIRRSARRYLLFLLLGMTACLFSAYVSTFLTGVLGLDTETASHEIAPLVEEIMKLLPVVFYLMVFDPRRKIIANSAILVAIGFATFENVCYLITYGSANLMRLVIRGFGTGAMHVCCGLLMALGLLFLWDRAWIRGVGMVALLCFVIRFHASFNLLVNETGAVFWIGSAIPVTILVLYLIFFHRKVKTR